MVREAPTRGDDAPGPLRRARRSGLGRQRPQPSRFGVLEQAGVFARLATSLPAYLRDRLEPAAAHADVHHDLARRGQNLLRNLTDGVLAVETSPYRMLLEHAGIKRHDLEELVGREGVEGTLERLYDAGVYVSLDEFKGRKPIVRGSLRLETSSRAFDNPLSVVHITAQSGGSRSSGTRVTIDLAHNARSAIYDLLLFETHDALDRPYVLWQPTLPYGAGVNAVLRYAKLGRTVDRWFSQSPTPGLGRAWQHGILTRYLLTAMRLQGRRVPWPEHVPLAQAERIARYLAELKADGRPALVNTNASSGTRICLAASEQRLDIAGTLFRLGGEPLTPARARVVAATGSKAVSIYGMGEIGRIGLPCANPAAVDEVHLLVDKLAVIRRTRRAEGAPPVPVNVYTTLVASTPKLMLNVESDDYGEIGPRSCGCPLERLGLGQHLHTIRSHEKLTSEGMNFLGHDLIRLIEEVLPARFGGGPTDFQFLEEEDSRGLPSVQLIVHPRLGEVPEQAVADCIVEFLNGAPSGAGLYGERWREAGALRVVRQEPYATSASKVLALHTRKPKDEHAPAHESRRGRT